MVSSGPLTDERYLALAGDAAEGVEGLSLWPDPVTSDLPGMKAYREAHAEVLSARTSPTATRSPATSPPCSSPRAPSGPGANLTRENLVTSLEGIKGWDSGILPPITIGADHETQRQGFWVKVEKGRFKQLTDWLKSD